ncbi:alpha-lytic protease prodomain-containing protein, partial [Streptomyces clavifer]
MRHVRRGLQRVVRLATVGALLCGGLMTASGAAGATTGGTSAPAEDGGGTTAPPPGLGERLLAQLGPSRTAGSWLGSDGRPVVAVTDEAAAAEAERAGARAQVVRHSMRRLRSATQDLGRAPRVPGTAWAVDYAS